MSDPMDYDAMIPIECSHCGASFEKRLGDMTTPPTFPCPKCGKDLSGDNLRAAARRAQEFAREVADDIASINRDFTRNR